MSQNSQVRSNRKYGSGNNYGWFDDVEDDCEGEEDNNDNQTNQELIHRALSLPSPLTNPPLYVLEDSLEAQQLWYLTAGIRPRQPPEERQYFESLWKENFNQSNVPINSDSNTPEIRQGSKEFNEDIMLRGRSHFSTTVSKGYLNHQLSFMTIQV